MVLGALATRDWRPMHHDKDFAVNRNGTQDIFLNTPNQAAWFERYLTDWTGPHGRLGRVTFRMKGSVFPGDTMVLQGVVESTRGRRRRLRLRHGGGDACRSTATSRPPAPPASPCPVLPTTTRGPGGATSGGPRRERVRAVGVPESVSVALEQKRDADVLDLDFDQEQELLRQTARDVLARHCSLDVVRAMEDDPVGYPAALWTQLGELDLIGLLLPEEYGGSGMSLVEGVALYQELGRALAPVPHFVSAVLSGGVLAAAGSEAQKEQWLRPWRRARRSSRRPGSSPRTGTRPAAWRRGPRPAATGSASTGSSATSPFAVGCRSAGRAGPDRRGGRGRRPLPGRSRRRPG